MNLLRELGSLSLVHGNLNDIRGLCSTYTKRKLLQVSSPRHVGRPVNVRAGAADVLGVLVFSALPFAAVQALADSDLGKKLQVRYCYA